MAAAKAAAPKTGHEIVVTVTVELVGVALIAILAGMSDGLGRVMVALMSGFLLVFLITNATFLKGVIPSG
jgi:hypothetical protein